MTDSTDLTLEQAIYYFHRHRDIFELKDNSYTASEIEAFCEEFETWIAHTENQKAYAMASDIWNSTEPLAAVTDEELESRGITLVNRKAELKRKLKLVAVLAVVDLLLSFVFPPLSLLEPVLILALIYLGIQYWREPALEEEVINNSDDHPK